MIYLQWLCYVLWLCQKGTFKKIINRERTIEIDDTNNLLMSNIKKLLDRMEHFFFFILL